MNVTITLDIGRAKKLCGALEYIMDSYPWIFDESTPELAKIVKEEAEVQDTIDPFHRELYALVDAAEGKV